MLNKVREAEATGSAAGVAKERKDTAGAGTIRVLPGNGLSLDKSNWGIQVPRRVAPCQRRSIETYLIVWVRPTSSVVYQSTDGWCFLYW